jgi:hypothetical protein
LSIGATFDRVLGAIEQAGPVTALRESTLAYPLVNALHIIGIALLFGAIVALDLRLIGWRREAGETDRLASLLLPVAIGGLVVAIPAGLLLFATDARAYAASRLFQAKILFIALAIGNALWLRASERRGPQPDRRAAVAGGASIALWLGAIVLGRLVGYF